MANNPLTIAALPLQIVAADRRANLDAVEQALVALRPGTDLLVLPELFSTGFVADPETVSRLAEPDNGMTLTRLRELAARFRVALCGSMLGCNPDRSEFYNRAFFIEPNGETTYCNKRHLFCLSPEAKLMTSGRGGYATVRFRGWSIGFGVCYDLRFPVWCRNRTVHGSPAYDVFVFVANWPEVRGYALDILLRARAIENQAYVVCANRSGSDDYGSYDGQSYLDDFMGRIVARSESAEVIYMTTDRRALEFARRRLPAANDADEFTINY
ncbi:MAG: nitrilase family protein [Muribaculaceae bacterium]|nr:nitrilase family protein [Muribaculaceae bacterium]